MVQFDDELQVCLPPITCSNILWFIVHLLINFSWRWTGRFLIQFDIPRRMISCYNRCDLHVLPPSPVFSSKMTRWSVWLTVLQHRSAIGNSTSHKFYHWACTVHIIERKSLCLILEETTLKRELVTSTLLYSFWNCRERWLNWTAIKSRPQCLITPDLRIPARTKSW